MKTVLKKIVVKIKTHFRLSSFFFRNRGILLEKYGKDRQATDDNKITTHPG